MGQMPSVEDQRPPTSPASLSSSSYYSFGSTLAASYHGKGRQPPARMSIQVYIGHNGRRLELDPNVTTSVEALRGWIAQHAGIQPRDQILLTPQGRQVRAQTLLTESEVFIFDSTRLGRSVQSPSSSGLQNSTGSDFNPGTPPDTITNQNDLQAWQHLFRVRESWANSLLRGCEAQAKQAERYLDEQAIIERSLGVAVASLQQHVKSAEQKYISAEEWAEETLQEQDAHIGNWEVNLESLSSVPARAEFARFLHAPSLACRRLSQQGNVTTLQAFVDVSATEKAASAAKSIMGGFSDKVGSMRLELETVSRESEELLRAVEDLSTRASAQSNSEPAQLLEEIQLIAKKMASDLDHVNSLARTSQSVSQASKMALLHTRNYIPQLSEHCAEMNELVQRTRQERESAADVAQEHMQTLSSIESKLAELYADVKALQAPQDDQQAFPRLALISRLPSVYGQLLVESVQRREWVTKMKRDSATLQEEVATYQEEEDKRRKKWIRSVEDVVNIDALQSNVLGIELSLRNEGGSWPMVTREELDEYLKTLSAVYGQGPVTEEMDQAIKDLDKPTRKQIKHAKAFKNGSMHEAAFGDTSLLLRGDEQHKALREANMRLEEDLRAQKSRVRKLEDLLHRQSQSSRTSLGDVFTPQSGTFPDRFPAPILPTRLPSDDASRSQGAKHRRLSSTQASEEKKLARRIVELEAELQAHKDDAATRKSSDAETQKQVEEAISTKKDLMENMEAQQREFAHERLALERELAEARERIDEIENELDRLMGSRDDERTGIDARITSLQDEIARLKEDASGHAARAATEQDARTALERKLELSKTARAQAEEQVRQMQMEREQHKEAEIEQLQVLTTAHGHLSPDAPSPSGFASLAATLEELARRTAAHVKDLEDAVAFAKAENESLWSSNERQKTELAEATEKQTRTEEQMRQTQESLAAEQAKRQALEQQLSNEQEQLRDLRSKFAEGETGSEVLRQRIAEEEARAGKLSSELAEAKSHINSMDVELMRLQKKHKQYLDATEASAVRLEKRAERAKDVSQRLYTNNARLSRLLERLGLVITYQEDGNMTVERASKMGASVSMSDPTSSMNRTISLTSPPPTRKSSTTDDSLDFSLARWPEAYTAEEEVAQFEAFMQVISRFNTDTFSEAVYKRLRDFEYTAKKYSKEAKESTKRAEAYKERSAKLKTETQAKIAVKDFKEGDLALFLPTRGQAKGAWAAFNIGCPHYFLAEKEGMRLGTRDFIVARISKVEQKVVDVSRSLPSHTDGRSIDSETQSYEDDNPFELSDGLTWWMVHATEERGAGGAPSTPGLGKSTVAAANVDAKGSIRIKRNSKSDDASKHLNKSLDSRRSSSTSKKGVAGALIPTLANATGGGVAGASSPTVAADAVSLRQRSESQASLRPPPAPSAGGGSGNKDGAGGLGIIADTDTPTSPAGNDDAQSQLGEQVRNDLLWGP
jgi:autophagy-related protein 11